MMKKTLSKILSGIAVACLLFSFSGCASTDDSVKEVVFDSGDTQAAPQEEAQEEQEVTEDSTVLVTADEASAYQVDAVAPAGKEGKKNYTGWIATSMKPVTNVVGNVKLFSNPRKGTFSISVLNEKEKAVPVLSTANEYTTTSFYLKAGRKIVKLCDDSSVVSAAKKTEKGLKVRYSVDKTAVVIIDFECFSSKEGEPEDSIKITAAIVSQSKKKNDFSLKFIMDTVLGETDRHHFYNSEGLPVKNEVLFHSMDQEKWFCSKNSRASMQVIFSGGESTPVESVALANFSTLDTKKWEADMTTFRSFDTVLSYNNSAAGIYWPKMALQPQEEGHYVFYISLAADGEVPGGAEYLVKEAAAQAAQEGQEEAAAQTKPAVQKPEETPVQNIEAVKEDKPAKEAVPPKKEEKPAQEAVPPKDEPEPVPAVQEKPEEKAAPELIGDDKLSVDYIQQLLDKIDQLEAGDPDLNKAEINALNAELDAIITILNSRNGE